MSTKFARFFYFLCALASEISLIFSDDFVVMIVLMFVVKL